MKKHFIFLSTIFFCSTYLFAQKKVEYYPNGKKKFEGSYVLKLPGFELNDYKDNPLENIQELDNSNRILISINEASAKRPYKNYNGICIFYYENGNKKYEGNFDNGVKEGKFIYYYLNGKKAFEQNYVNGMPNGEWKQWHPNATLGGIEHYTCYDQKILHRKDSLYNLFIKSYITEGYSSMGKSSSLLEIDKKNRNFEDVIKKLNSEKKDRNYKYARKLFKHIENLPMNTMLNGLFTYYYPDGSKSYIFEYKDDVPVGTWQIWGASKNKLCDIIFKNGEIIELKNYDSEVPSYDESISISDSPPEISKEVDPPPIESRREIPQAIEPPKMNSERNQEVFTFVEQEAEMPGGEEKMMELIAKNIQYPEQAKEIGITGRVLVDCIVELDGSLSNIKVKKALGYGCDEEAIRVVELLSKFRPAKQNGKVVKSRITIPVLFTINED